MAVTETELLNMESSHCQFCGSHEPREGDPLWLVGRGKSKHAWHLSCRPQNLKQFVSRKGPGRPPSVRTLINRASSPPRTRFQQRLKRPLQDQTFAKQNLESSDYSPSRDNKGRRKARLSKESRSMSQDSVNTDDTFIRDICLDRNVTVTDEGAFTLPESLLTSARSKLTHTTEWLSEELRKLQGIDSIKSRIISLASIIHMRAVEKSAGRDQPMHFAITGSPGTGKATIARLLMRVFHDAELATGYQITSLSSLVGFPQPDVESQWSVISQDASASNCALLLNSECLQSHSEQSAFLADRIAQCKANCIIFTAESSSFLKRFSFTDLFHIHLPNYRASELARILISKSKRKLPVDESEITLSLRAFTRVIRGKYNVHLVDRIISTIESRLATRMLSSESSDSTVLSLNEKDFYSAMVDVSCEIRNVIKTEQVP